MTAFKSQKIKEVIKTLLKKKGITYNELAPLMECSVPTIKRILGPEELTLNRLLELCEIVEIDLAELDALTRDGDAKALRFTKDQEDFLVKHPHHMAYLMKLFDGKTPRQIAESFNLTQRSTDKYLIALEKQGLIRVSGQQKVRPAFKAMPHLGTGPLARVYFEGIVKNSGRFFINHIDQLLSLKKADNGEKLNSNFTVEAVKISRESYRVWAEEQIKSLKNLEKIGSYEEKAKDATDLMTAVVVQAQTLVKNDYEGLKIMEETFGKIINL